MVFRSSIDVVRDKKTGAWLIVLLFIPCMLIDGIKIISIATKSALVRKWSREIMNRIKSEDQKSKPKEDDLGCKNLAGLGGQNFRIRWTTWDEIFLDSNCSELRRWSHRPNVVRDHLFFAYFGPLEAWCDRNLHSNYYLWSDDTRINLVLSDTTDEILWKMAWGNGMPTLSDVEDLVGSS